MNTTAINGVERAQTGTASEVLLAFLRLGCVSFGGPIAHLGYFHTEFVERRRWCDQETFAEIVALAQSAPGPASSQVGFAMGLLRAGWRGGLAAWVGFTTPSAVLMLMFAFGRGLLNGRVGQGIVHGLQLVAVAVVAQAIAAMRRSLAPDAPRLVLAAVAAAIVFFAPPLTSTIAAIAIGALFGGVLPGSATVCSRRKLNLNLPKSAAVLSAILLLSLLMLLPATNALLHGHGVSSQSLEVFEAFYRTGALVFGGGHVVLPLLENSVVARGWVDQQSFLAGYGAAQAMPGPLFTFAAYLGAAILPTPGRVLLSGLCLVAIFLPGLLVIVAVLPFWGELRERRRIQRALSGVNAAVVGVLVAAFIRPVWTAAVHSLFDVVVALAAFLLLVRFKLPPWIIVVGVAAVSAVVAALPR